MLSSDAFTVINRALIQTGNQPTVNAWDGTDEWLAGWDAYEIWLPYCLEARDWSFQRTSGPLTRVGAATWPRYSDAYAFPANCLHLLTVWRTDMAAEMPPYYGWGMTRDGLLTPQLEYKILGQTIQTTAPQGLTGEWLTMPAAADQYTQTFIIALIGFVSSSLFISLNEDFAAGEKAQQMAQALLEQAAARTAQQENRKVAFRSRMIERRRARYAPWGTTY